MKLSRVTLAGFVLLLVIVAFARAHYASSTGIRIVGDGLDYESMAAEMRLEGRAPFVYRPAVPLIVGALFGNDLTLGFAIVCGLSMFAALFLAGALAQDAYAGHGLAAVLFFNYQVLFAAANVARLDIVVLAVQLGFVALALARRPGMYFLLLPLCALLKESTLLGLGALAIAAFPRDRVNLARLSASAAAFVGIHAAVRAVADPTSAVPPYQAGVPTVDALRAMLASNLGAVTPLQMFVAWGGLALVAVWVSLSGERRRTEPTLAVMFAFLLLFPLPLVTDVHRAWFELLAPMVLYFVLRRLQPRYAGSTYPALALALAASVIPLAARFFADDHLYLLIVEDRLSPSALAGLAAALIIAAAALGFWITPPASTDREAPVRTRPAPRQTRQRP